MRPLAVLGSILVLATTGCAGRHSAVGEIARAKTRAGSVGTSAWSPSGSRIAWSQLIGAREQVWVAARDGSSAHAVSGPIDSLGQIAWLPDNTLIYWANFRLFRLTLAGRSSMLAPVIGGRFSIDARGTRLAFGPPIGAGPIVIYALATGAARRIGGKPASDSLPSLSPDGNRVAFSRRDGIWIARTAGGAAHRILRSGYCVRWSPDGRMLAYIDSSDSSLRLVSPTGGKRTILLRAASCNESVPPGWSPNSQDLAVVRGHEEQRVMIVDARTHKSNVVTRPAIGATIDFFSWSPDSSELLITSRRTPRSCSLLWKVNTTDGSSRLIRGC